MFRNSQWQSAQLRTLYAYRNQKSTLPNVFTNVYNRDISPPLLNKYKISLILHLSRRVGKYPYYTDLYINAEELAFDFYAEYPVYVVAMKLYLMYVGLQGERI